MAYPADGNPDPVGILGGASGGSWTRSYPALDATNPDSSDRQLGAPDPLAELLGEQETQIEDGARLTGAAGVEEIEARAAAAARDAGVEHVMSVDEIQNLLEIAREVEYQRVAAILARKAERRRAREAARVAATALPTSRDPLQWTPDELVAWRARHGFGLAANRALTRLVQLALKGHYR